MDKLGYDINSGIPIINTDHNSTFVKSLEILGRDPPNQGNRAQRRLEWKLRKIQMKKAKKDAQKQSRHPTG